MGSGLKLPVGIDSFEKIRRNGFADAKRMLGRFLPMKWTGIIISKQVMHLRTRIRHISLKCLQVRMRI